MKKIKISHKRSIINIITSDQIYREILIKTFILDKLLKSKKDFSCYYNIPLGYSKREQYSISFIVINDYNNYIIQILKNNKIFFENDYKERNVFSSVINMIKNFKENIACLTLETTIGCEEYEQTTNNM